MIPFYQDKPELMTKVKSSRTAWWSVHWRTKEPARASMASASER
ncbi:hypothetical protein GQ600_17599 [Phytophthora cactorum]|nr:hypothetical protein GQ600_17599 [Phytophthora cactorum]